MKINFSNLTLKLTLDKKSLNSLGEKLSSFTIIGLILLLTFISVFSFLYFLDNGLGLAYNDARSHLDIGRRVVEGLKPGLAQLGSVWLPLSHLLMVPTIWNDFMWHTGLSGALQSMISFVATGILIYLFLKKLKVGTLGIIVSLFVYLTNINILYMQSTAMTELLLLATMLAGVYELYIWHETNNIRNLIKSSFWIMLATLIRYDGWFLLAFSALLVIIRVLKQKGYKAAEAFAIFFCSLAGFGVVLWLLWNLLIFKDPLYFVFGPYSAHAQQAQLDQAGVLVTKYNLPLSIKFYFYALAYNSGAFNVILGVFGAIIFWLNKKIPTYLKIASTALFAPFIFNILALYEGHSVLFIQGLSGDTWFNIRYGIMMIPAIAIFIGYLIQKAGTIKYSIIGLIIFVTFFSIINYDAVTIDDARVGSSQKNVSEVSNWLNAHAKNEVGYILISAASHDAIIFTSGLPMSRFIHEGTGAYWTSATKSPDRWARWIIMRTHDENDRSFKFVEKSQQLYKYSLKGHFPFADIYELKPEYLGQLQTKLIKNNL